MLWERKGLELSTVSSGCSPQAQHLSRTGEQENSRLKQSPHEGLDLLPTVWGGQSHTPGCTGNVPLSLAVPGPWTMGMSRESSAKASNETNPSVSAPFDPRALCLLVTASLLEAAACPCPSPEVLGPSRTGAVSMCNPWGALLTHAANPSTQTTFRIFPHVKVNKRFKVPFKVKVFFFFFPPKLYLFLSASNVLHCITPAGLFFFFVCFQILKGSRQSDAGELGLERELGSELGDPRAGRLMSHPRLPAARDALFGALNLNPWFYRSWGIFCSFHICSFLPFDRDTSNTWMGWGWSQQSLVFLLHKQNNHKHHHFLCKLPLPLWNFLWDSRLWVWMRISSHRKFKDKWFDYRSTNSYLVWIFSWNRRENYKTFCLTKWSSFLRRRKARDCCFFKICNGKHVECRQKNVKYLKYEYFWMPWK